MNEKNLKPNVFPKTLANQDAVQSIDSTNFELEKKKATNEIYDNAKSQEDTPETHVMAVEMMRKRTEEQLKQKETVGEVKYPELSEKKVHVSSKQEEEIKAIMERSKEQMKIRDAHLANNIAQTNNYQEMISKIENKVTQVPEPPKKIIQTTTMENYGQLPNNLDPFIIELSQPDFNTPFDVIPLPSRGKLYGSKSPSIRVSFMTTADENILTSPNLLKSGKFLEILLNRKILETGIRYKNLHVGDRNAIMIWLRATGYGEMYPITLIDDNGEVFETEINLTELKMKPLGAEPDAEGLFDFKFNLCKSNIKFKLLTCGDIDEIDALIDADKENGYPLNKTTTYMLERTIVEVDGNRDRELIKTFANSIRIKDGKDLLDYIEKIESGVDLNIEVKTPRGESISTFLPLNIKFFWPNIRV